MYSHAQRISGLNDEMLMRCKENHLNTQYNHRKTKLKEITKENKKIYKRINSQKSLYSNEDLNKSYQSSVSISRRISRSKLSHRSSSSVTPKNQPSEAGSSKFSSRVSRHSRHRTTTNFHSKINEKQSIFTVESQNINKVSEQHLENFKSLFVRAGQENKANMCKNRTAAVKKKPEPFVFNPLPMPHEGFLHQIAEELSGRKEKGKFKNRRMLI